MGKGIEEANVANTTFVCVVQDAAKAPSVTGSIHHNGRIYVVESCGSGCHVLYYRDQSFFDNLHD